MWIVAPWWWPDPRWRNVFGGPLGKFFDNESEVERPGSTPIFGDGVAFNSSSHDTGQNGPFILGPRASELPSQNLASGPMSGLTPAATFGMGAFTISRHGSRPVRIPTQHPPEAKLPGAVNLSFYDGHAEQVKLDGLWNLYWHADYVPPEKRPGLK
jgi:prepilin-type processing-associated H-X9-DG protein